MPYAAGGSHDLMVRAMEKVAKKHFGQAIIVKNMPGAGATIGWNELAGSEADGYMLATVSTTALLQPLYSQTRYHYPSALDPLVQILDMPVIAVTQYEQPWNNMTELVSYARKHPGVVKFGHGGLGAGGHVVGEMVAMRAEVNLPQVPFKGESEAFAALLGGHVQLIFTTPLSIKEYVKSGKVKVLGIAAEKHLTDPVFSNVPTFQEEGLDIVFSSWVGLVAPKVMPPEIKGKLLDNLEKIVNDPEYIQNIKGLGMEVSYLGHDDFLKKWLKETRKLTQVVKESGIAEKIAEQKK